MLLYFDEIEPYMKAFSMKQMKRFLELCVKSKSSLTNEMVKEFNDLYKISKDGEKNKIIHKDWMKTYTEKEVDDYVKKMRKKVNELEQNGKVVDFEDEDL